MKTESLPLVKFKLGDKLISYDLASEVQINQDTMNQCIIEQPSKFAFIGLAYAAYRGASEGAKVKRDIEYAKLDAAIRQLAEQRNEKVTEKSVENSVKMHPKYQEAQRIYLEVSAIENQLSVAVEAFRQRKDMLISLASNWRAELDGDIKVQKQEYKDRLKQKGERS